MKVLVILALAVAVAHAGFSGSLTQQARPILNQAISQIRADLAVKVPARNSAEAGLQTAFVDALSNQIEGVLGSIEGVVNGIQVAAQQVVSNIHAAISQAQALGQTFIQNAQTILGNLASQFLNIFGGNNRALSPAIQSLIAQIASNPQFVSMVHNTQSYQCLIAGGIPLSVAYVQQLYAAGELNAGLLEDPVIANCLEQAGGLHALISGSSIVQWVQSLLGGNAVLISMIHNVINQVVGDEMGAVIISALSGNRGFFGDLWGGISNAASGAWNNLSQGVVGIAQHVANVAVQTWQSAVEKFEIIKQLAEAFIQGGIASAQMATQDAAQEFLEFLAPFQADLGDLYTNSVNQVLSIWNNIQLPQWQSRQAIRAF